MNRRVEYGLVQPIQQIQQVQRIQHKKQPLQELGQHIRLENRFYRGG